MGVGFHTGLLFIQSESFKHFVFPFFFFDDVVLAYPIGKFFGVLDKGAFGFIVIPHGFSQLFIGRGISGISGPESLY